MRRWIGTVLALLAGAAWFALLRPVALGGDVAYILVAGSSMESTIDAGSMVIASRQQTYSVGDVVAYRIRDGEVGAGLNVIHRIVGGSATSGFLMRGDNTQVNDIWRPMPSEIVGRATIVIPGVMPILLFLRSPIVIASLAAAWATYLILGLWPAPAREPDPIGRAMSSGVSHSRVQ